MNDQRIEERIRERAYELCLADGAMEGCSDECWRQAREIVETEIANERLNGKTDETSSR